MVFKQVNVPPLGVQDIGGSTGKYIEVGDQLQQLVLIKQNIQAYHPLMYSKVYPLRPIWAGADMGVPP